MYLYKPRSTIRTCQTQHGQDHPKAAAGITAGDLKIVIITMIIWTSFTRVFYNCHCDKSIWFAKSLSIQYLIAIANTPTSSSPSHASSSSKLIAGKQKPGRLHFCWDFGVSKDPGLAELGPMTHSGPGAMDATGCAGNSQLVADLTSRRPLSQHIDRSHFT